jgi:hypothetical protein
VGKCGCGTDAAKEEKTAPSVSSVPEEKTKRGRSDSSTPKKFDLFIYLFIYL